MTTYTYRRLGTDELVEVDFDTHMANLGGFITLPDGAEARRVQPGSVKRVVGEPVAKPIVSDNLGCDVHAVNEFREDAAKHGYSGVEWKPDPTCPTFYQAHFSSRSEWRKYVAHRGLYDRNGLNSGVGITRDELVQAIQRAGGDPAEVLGRG
jgi:hypothetical protein